MRGVWTETVLGCFREFFASEPYVLVRGLRELGPTTMQMRLFNSSLLGLVLIEHQTRWLEGFCTCKLFERFEQISKLLVLKE